MHQCQKRLSIDLRGFRLNGQGFQGSRSGQYIYVCNGNQCNILKNLLDEKGIQYHYVDVSKIPHELLTYLRMYCNTYPIVLGVKYFSTLNETLEYFKDV
jgi:hypothetical protein